MTTKTNKNRLSTAYIFLLACVGCSPSIAQVSTSMQALPDAPPTRLITQRDVQQGVLPISNVAPQSSSNAQAPDAMPNLTRAEAEQMAIKDNPRVSIGRLLALAQHQIVRETRAAELPTAAASITAVDAEDGSRISAGSLTASRLIEHAGAGGGF